MANNDGYNLTSTITHMQMNLTMAGQEVNFDSDSTEDRNGKLGWLNGKLISFIGAGFWKPDKTKHSIWSSEYLASLKKPE